MRTIEILDLFCGAGGTSTGAIEAVHACGRRPRLTAINHWSVAIETHERNHPNSRHLCTGVDQVNPRTLYPAGDLGILWASPECTHHSVARGGKPINDQSRATAWCVVKFADQLLPPVILVENVPEFRTWGPLIRVRVMGKNGKLTYEWRPDPKRKGQTFRAWVSALESLGYRVEWKVQCSADFGDPTTRERLIVQAVRGRLKTVWPNPTHAEHPSGSLLPWVPASSIIDWSLPCPSIYERKKALSPKTLSRIYEGLKKFGLKPSLICMEHGGVVRESSRPMPTITTAKGGAIGVAKPYLVRLRGGSESHLRSSSSSVDDPVPAVTANGTHVGVVSPFLVQVAHGNGGDQNADSRRSRSIDTPLPTVCGQRGEWAFCEPSLLPQGGGGVLRSVDEPAPTIATDGAVALVEPFLVSYYGTGNAASLDRPMESITTKDRFGFVRPVVEFDGQRYLLDIGFRMLQPHELALAQGFAPEYVFAGTKTQQVKQIGNAVTRRLARAHVAAVLKQNPDVRFLTEVFE